MAAVVPAGVSESDLAQALDAFEGALGHDRVITAEAELREFRDPYSYKNSDEFDASAAVMPTSVEEVQQVVRIANEYGIPLWTFGQGRNNTYGGPAPRVQGSVLVNLRLMNRVLEVNEELAYAVVEPGVRWFDLFDAVEAAGGTLWPSIPDLGWGSVVGNSLEYGRGYTPNGDHAGNICGMEVVLPSGEVLRTGMGAMTNSKAWHVYQHSFGPSVEGLFKQSNLGIVTSMGVWLMPRPEVYAPCWAQFEGQEAIEPLLDAVRGLMLEDIIRCHPLISRGISTGASDSERVLDQSSRTWTIRFALYGREEIVDANYRVAERTLSAIPGVTVWRKTYRGDDRSGPLDHDERVQAGIPDMDLLDLFMVPYGDDTGHLDFSPVGPFTGREIASTIKLMDSLYARHGHTYVVGILLLPRSAIHVSTAFYDTKDEAQTNAVYAAYTDMVVEMARAGYPIYRTNIHHMDVVAEQYDFNDHALRRFTETIKDALDPNGILSPGKQGIWPKGRQPART